MASQALESCNRREAGYCEVRDRSRERLPCRQPSQKTLIADKPAATLAAMNGGLEMVVSMPACRRARFWLGSTPATSANTPTLAEAKARRMPTIAAA